MKKLFHICFVILAMLLSFNGKAQIHVVKNEIVTVEAEDFSKQFNDSIRKWYIISERNVVSGLADPDQAHFESASGKAYLEILPDTRTNHDEKLIKGENFIDIPGAIAVLEYKVRFNEPGKYFVWVKAFSTGSEDNGIHVGLDGEWPESGAKMQWCEGKNQWTWASKQRTVANHCGEEGLIFLEIDSPGLHTVTFSMREDGFEFDKFVLSKNYIIPEL